MILKDVVIGKVRRKENVAWQDIAKISLFTENVTYFSSMLCLVVCFNETFERAITQTEASVSSKVNEINLGRTNLYLFILHRAEIVFWHLTNKNVLTSGYNFCVLENL